MSQQGMALHKRTLLICHAGPLERAKSMYILVNSQSWIHKMDPIAQIMVFLPPHK